MTTGEGKSRVRLRNRRAHMQNKRIVLTHYGGEKPKCACCGCEEYWFLVIDHIDNNGAVHRKSVGSGSGTYKWLKKNNFPPGFQVLCDNCNMAKGRYGHCPHTAPVVEEDYSTLEVDLRHKFKGRKEAQCQKCKGWRDAKGYCHHRKNMLNARKTHCPKGHAYSGSNVRYRSDSRRYCGECWRQRSAARRRDKVAGSGDTAATGGTV